MKMEESSPNSIENTVGKGEIAHLYEQFLLFPQFFQRTRTGDMLNVFVWERVNGPNVPLHPRFD